MGFIGSFLGQVAGKAVNAGVDVAKQKLDDHQEAKEAENRRKANKKYINKAFRLPTGFCDAACGKIWRAKGISDDGRQLHLYRKNKGKEYNEWFYVEDILEYYEDI